LDSEGLEEKELRVSATLRIYKKKSALGIPITFEIGFTKRYAETTEQAVAMANTILSVELRD
jgi:hypothetical protein